MKAVQAPIMTAPRITHGYLTSMGKLLGFVPSGGLSSGLVGSVSANTGFSLIRHSGRRMNASDTFGFAPTETAW